MVTLTPQKRELRSRTPKMLNSPNGSVRRKRAAERHLGRRRSVGRERRLQAAIERQRNSSNPPEPHDKPGPATDERQTGDYADRHNAHNHAQEKRPEVVIAAHDPLADDSSDSHLRSKQHDQPEHQ